VQTGPSEIVAPTSAPQHDAPELARLDVEDGALAADLEFDLDTAFEEPAEAAAPADEELDLELGELELGSGDAALDLGLPGTSEAHEGEPGPALPELAPRPVPVAAPAAPAAEEVEDLGLLEGADEIETKLELARAYIDMGDVDGARDILDEVMSEGSGPQRELASELLERLRAP
jgi:pilus assembly protein FimV